MKEKLKASLVKPLTFAMSKHKDQTRKNADGTPYMIHPVRVSQLLIRSGVEDTNVLAAALLHDTLEDTQTTPEELQVEFGENIARIVQELTDDKSLPKSVRKEQQRQTAPSLSPEATLVRIADKIANLEDVIYDPPTTWPLEQRLAYVDWAEAVVKNCQEVNAGLVQLFMDVARDGREHLGSYRIAMGCKYRVTCSKCGYETVVEGGRGQGMRPKSAVQTCFCQNCKELFDRSDATKEDRDRPCTECNGRLIDWSKGDRCPKCSGRMDCVAEILWD